MVSIGPAVDILQQSLSLLDGDAMLEDLGVTLLIEFSLDDDKGLSLARKPLGLYPVHREHLADDVIEVRDSLVM
jgi:hypothetical protein